MTRNRAQREQASWARASRWHLLRAPAGYFRHVAAAVAAAGTVKNVVSKSSCTLDAVWR
jgi:hypothetical protein